MPKKVLSALLRGVWRKALCQLTHVLARIATLLLFCTFLYFFVMHTFTSFFPARLAFAWYIAEWHCIYLGLRWNVKCFFNPSCIRPYFFFLRCGAWGNLGHAFLFCYHMHTFSYFAFAHASLTWWSKDCIVLCAVYFSEVQPGGNLEENA